VANSFVFDQPKDILTGDFVWTFKKEDRLFFRCFGDCTGHGVPGAMLAVFMVNMLNQIISIQQDETPADILEKLDELIQKHLSVKEEHINDSAEIALIDYNLKTNKLVFSSANRPLVRVRDGEIEVYKGTKYVLGYPERRIFNVENTEIDVQEGDMIFMFSDGFVDQFGGPKDKRFLNKRLLALLKNNADLPVDQQYEKIKSTFDNWKGLSSQTDDVLLVGIRI
jgi:serine phosphatase RsbU (regulator of sigma subunit)